MYGTSMHHIHSCHSYCITPSLIIAYPKYKVQSLSMKLRRFAVLQIIVCNSGVKPHARDEAAQELDRVTRHQDAALELAEERHRGWILANHNAFQREQALQE